jgi:hypothetical protein
MKLPARPGNHGDKSNIPDTTTLYPVVTYRSSQHRPKSRPGPVGSSPSPSQRTRVFSRMGWLQLGHRAGAHNTYSITADPAPITSTRTEVNGYDTDALQLWQPATRLWALRIDASPTATSSTPAEMTFSLITLTSSFDQCLSKFGANPNPDAMNPDKICYFNDL